MTLPIFSERDRRAANERLRQPSDTLAQRSENIPAADEITDGLPLYALQNLLILLPCLAEGNRLRDMFGLSPRSLARACRNTPDRPLRADQTRTILELAEIGIVAERCLGDIEIVGSWMAKENPFLDGQRPAAMLSSSEGRVALMILLSQIDGGIYA